MFDIIDVANFTSHNVSDSGAPTELCQKIFEDICGNRINARGIGIRPTVCKDLVACV